MTYGLTLAKQTQNFFVAFGFGFLLGILYDVFFIIRSAVSGRRVVTFICDSLFVAAASVLSFTLLLVITDGQIRFYVLLGEALGFTVYYLSLGAFTVRVSEKIIAFFKKLCRFLMRIFIRIFKVVSYPFRCVFSILGKFFKKIRVFLRKIMKKSLKKSKNHLHFGYNMLYTQRVYRGILRPDASNYRKGRLLHSGKQADKKE